MIEDYADRRRWTDKLLIVEHYHRSRRNDPLHSIESEMVRRMEVNSLADAHKAYRDGYAEGFDAGQNKNPARRKEASKLIKIAASLVRGCWLDGLSDHINDERRLSRRRLQKYESDAREGMRVLGLRVRRIADELNNVPD